MERKTEWFDASVEPEPGRLLVFHFGAGPVVGQYFEGRFIRHETSRGWMREFVSRWSYQDTHRIRELVKGITERSAETLPDQL